MITIIIMTSLRCAHARSKRQEQRFERNFAFPGQQVAGDLGSKFLLACGPHGCSISVSRLRVRATLFGST
jgi:hypothetical protein